MTDQPPSSDKSEEERGEADSDPENIDELGGVKKSQLTGFNENFIGQKSRDRIAESQESTRSNLAIGVIIIYGATLLLSFIVIGFGLNKDQRKEILTLILTSQSTIIGGAVGFYFGNRSTS